MEIKAMTLNMKTNTPFTAGASLFSNRAQSIREMIRFHDPDLIGVQEFRESMLESLDGITEQYAFFGRERSLHRDDERNCILFRKERFDFMQGSTFWLSKTPEEPGSRIYGSVFPRIATVGILKDKETGIMFTFCNTHLDYLLPSVRLRQAEILGEELHKRVRGEFLILTGDFNTTANSQAVRNFLKKRKGLIDAVPVTLGSTMHGFISSASHNYRPIDHIFVSNNVRIIKTEIIKGMYMGVYPSDHCPVMTMLAYKKNPDTPKRYPDLGSQSAIS